MKDLIINFPNQLNDAINIGKNFELDASYLSVQNICISGLGGSGIGGDYVRLLARAHSHLPLLVNRDYQLPRFVNQNTLAIFSSYSGNTEETLTSFEQAIACRAKLICISSGGQLLARAKSLHIPYIQLPSGYPPRAALAYSVVQQLFILDAMNCLPSDTISDLQIAIDTIIKLQNNIKQRAHEIVADLGNSLPIIYATSIYEPIAVRLRQQLNENAKILCWHHVLPEMNHNEIVGWTETHPDKKVIFIYDTSQETQINKHTVFLKNVVSQLCEKVLYIAPVGDTLLQKYFYLTHLVDWISVLLAEERQQDATQVEVINQLKSSLIS